MTKKEAFTYTAALMILAAIAIISVLTMSAYKSNHQSASDDYVQLCGQGSTEFPDCAKYNKTFPDGKYWVTVIPRIRLNSNGIDGKFEPFVTTGQMTAPARRLDDITLELINGYSRAVFIRSFDNDDSVSKNRTVTGTFGAIFDAGYIHLRPAQVYKYATLWNGEDGAAPKAYPSYTRYSVVIVAIYYKSFGDKQGQIIGTSGDPCNDFCLDQCDPCVQCMRTNYADLDEEDYGDAPNCAPQCKDNIAAVAAEDCITNTCGDNLACGDTCADDAEEKCEWNCYNTKKVVNDDSCTACEAAFSDSCDTADDPDACLQAKCSVPCTESPEHEQCMTDCRANPDNSQICGDDTTDDSSNDTCGADDPGCCIANFPIGCTADCNTAFKTKCTNDCNTKCQPSQCNAEVSDCNTSCTDDLATCAQKCSAVFAQCISTCNSTCMDTCMEDEANDPCLASCNLDDSGMLPEPDDNNSAAYDRYGTCLETPPPDDSVDNSSP